MNTMTLTYCYYNFKWSKTNIMSMKLFPNISSTPPPKKSVKKITEKYQGEK